MAINHLLTRMILQVQVVFQSYLVSIQYTSLEFFGATKGLEYGGPLTPMYSQGMTGRFWED